MFARADKSLGEFERKALGDRLAVILRKHNAERYMKDEFIFLGILGFAVTKRIREERTLAQAAARQKPREEGKPRDEKANQVAEEKTS